MKKIWAIFCRDRRHGSDDVKFEPDGTSVAPASIPIEPPMARTEEERMAAAKAFIKLAKQGWKSGGPYGPRAELYG